MIWFMALRWSSWRGATKADKDRRSERTTHRMIFHQENTHVCQPMEISVIADVHSRIWLPFLPWFLSFYEGREGKSSLVEEAVRNVILKNRRTDLDLSQVSDYDCPLVFGQRDEEVLIRNCSALAVFTDGTSAEVSIKQKEFRKKRYRHAREKMVEYKIDFTVTIHGLGPDFQGESSISSILRASF